jgi:hypothetical protein
MGCTFFHNRAEGLLATGDKGGDGDGRQDTDDSDNDHQSGMGKTCLIHLSILPASDSSSDHTKSIFSVSHVSSSSE